VTNCAKITGNCTVS